MSIRATRRLVNDAPIRVFHGLFAAGFAIAWLTGDADEWRALHVALGYGLAGLLTWRLAYGLIGPRPARLDAMTRRAGGLLVWLRLLPARLRENGRPGDWLQGLTLLTAMLPLLLMSGLPFLVLSGLASHQDWGDLGHFTGELHEGLANALGLIAIAHPLLVIAGSVLKRRNLAAVMWSGRTAGPGPDLVHHERPLWALLLAVATVLAVGALWQEERLRTSTEPEAMARHHGQAEDDED